MSMHASERVSERGTGSAFFASVLMIIGGAMALLMGVAGIVEDTFYVIPANYWITFNAATWGWVFLGYGVVVLLAAGIGVLTGAEWSRWLGIVVMAVAAVVNFLFVPILPFMALTAIAVDLWVIHSLVVSRKEQMIYLNPATVSSQELQQH